MRERGRRRENKSEGGREREKFGGEREEYADKHVGDFHHCLVEDSMPGTLVRESDANGRYIHPPLLKNANQV